MKNNDFSLNISCLCLYGTFTVFMLNYCIDKNAYWLFSLFDFHLISFSIILFWIKNIYMAKYFDLDSDKWF